MRTADEAIEFVKEHGVVLEAARGPVPSLVEAIIGASVRGSWWGHHRAHEIFQLTRAMRSSPDVLVCRLVDGKITYVHRRLWTTQQGTIGAVLSKGIRNSYPTYPERPWRTKEPLPLARTRRHVHFPLALRPSIKSPAALASRLIGPLLLLE